MKKKLLPLALLFVSMSSVAGEFSVTKTQVPNSILNGVRALSMHRIMGNEYPTPSSMTGARLAAVSWTSTSYPQSIDEEAELCFHRVGNAPDCHKIQPGSSGTKHLSATYPWGYASYILIKHSHSGGPIVSRPLGSDSVTFHMSYY